MDAQSSAGVAARQLEFDKVILTYPVLYKYFYQGQELNADDVEYHQAMAATQLLANYFDGYFQQRGMYRQMWPDDKWESYIQDHVVRSPVLRRYLRENELWFAPKFVNMCQAVTAQNAELNAATDSHGTRYPGCERQAVSALLYGALRPGSYLRIVLEGEVGAGDEIRVVLRPDHDLTIRDVFRIYTRDRDEVERLLAVPQMSESWRRWADD